MTLREALSASPVGAAWTRATLDSYGHGTVRGYADGTVTFRGGREAQHEVELQPGLAAQVAGRPGWTPCGKEAHPTDSSLKETGMDWYEQILAAMAAIPEVDGFDLDSVDARGCPYYRARSGHHLYSLSPSGRLRPALNPDGSMSPDLDV